jgi:hypothetical protein
MKDLSSTNRVTMPKWPAWVLFATMAACAVPAVSASADAGEAPVSATAQPGSLASAPPR